MFVWWGISGTRPSSRSSDWIEAGESLGAGERILWSILGGGLILIGAVMLYGWTTHPRF